MKKYTVSWLIKANRTEWREGKIIEAENAKEAKLIAWKEVKAKTGRHAFDICAKAWKDGYTWQAMDIEDSINRDVKLIAEYGEDFQKHLDRDIATAKADGMTVTFNGKKYEVRQ